MSGLVSDALAVLGALGDAELDATQAEAVGLLGWSPAKTSSRASGRGAAGSRARSPRSGHQRGGPDSRHVHKSRRSYRDGYEAHLAAEPETGLVTQAKLTPANAGDGPTGLQLLSDEPDALEVLADSAYGGGGTRAGLRAAGHLQTIKPLALRAAVPDGFTKDDFRIDLDHQSVTCPAGHTVGVTPSSQAVFGQRCSGCPLRTRCTTAKDGKTLRVHPHEAELAAARRRASDPEFIASYRRWRPMVERSIAWLVAGGNRRVPYRGLARNQQWLSLRVAAINLRRLVSMGLNHHRAGWMLA